MQLNNFTKNQWELLIGDIFAIFLTVAVGFLNHETLTLFLQRFAFTFIPWTISWLLIAPKFKLFDRPGEKINKQIANILMAMLIASPLAAILRAAWLGTGALPLFALIMGLSAALGLSLWRFVYGQWLLRRDQ